MKAETKSRVCTRLDKDVVITLSSIEDLVYLLTLLNVNHSGAINDFGGQSESLKKILTGSTVCSNTHDVYAEIATELRERGVCV